MPLEYYELPSPRLTRGEYWLLESVAEHEIPAGWLGSDSLGEAINKQPHGLGQDELLETVLELQRQGLICFVFGSDRTECKSLSTSQVKNALVEKLQRGKPRTFVYLTAEGGRVWEAFAAPMWDKYIADSYGFDESLCQDTTEFICTNRGLLERYLQSRYPSFSQIGPSQVWWDILEPWEATYWKTLPKAHRVRFVDPDYEADETPLPPWHMHYFFRSGWYRWD